MDNSKFRKHQTIGNYMFDFVFFLFSCHAGKKKVIYWKQEGLIFL